MEDKNKNTYSKKLVAITENPLIFGATIILSTVALIFIAGGLFKVCTYTINNYKDLSAAFKR